jgi:hypothetical protein
MAQANVSGTTASSTAVSCSSIGGFTPKTHGSA